MSDNKKYYVMSSKQILKHNVELWNIVNDHILDEEVIWKAKFYLYEVKTTIIPKCHCGNNVKFVDMVNGFKESCSRSCMYNSPSVKSRRRQTNLDKYGVDNASKSEVSKERTRQTNVERYGVEHTSQAESTQNKRIENNLAKHNVEHTSQLDSVKDKAKATNNEKYGVDNPMQSTEVLERVRQTNIERYGVEWVGQSDDVKDKIKQTNLERYGVECTLSNSDVRDKIKLTNIERYGSIYPTQNVDVMIGAKQTNIERYGVDWGLQSETIKDKIKQTNLERYGVANVSNSHVVQSKKSMTNFNKAALVINDERYTLIELINQEYTLACVECQDSFQIQWQLKDDRNRNNQVVCTNCNPIVYGTSMGELMMFQYIESIFSGEILRNFRLNNKEIDIYLPELKIGFEHNGLYWHSEVNKPQSYHYDKMVFFNNNGIKLLQFWEDDWINKQSIIKSMIANSINVSQRIFARKCEVRVVTDNVAIRKFLTDNHIQGFVGSVAKIGLYYNNKLVSLMTFGALRKSLGHKSTSGEWELLRFCNKLNTTVVGGASRLFKYFINNYEYSKILTYSLNTHSEGKLYEVLDFEYLGNTKPNYHWGKGNVRQHRFNFRKDKLIKDGFDPSKTEVEIMHERKYFRIFDAGSKRWIYTNTKKHP